MDLRRSFESWRRGKQRSDLLLRFSMWRVSTQRTVVKILGGRDNEEGWLIGEFDLCLDRGCVFTVETISHCDVWGRIVQFMEYKEVFKLCRVSRGFWIWLGERKNIQSYLQHIQHFNIHYPIMRPVQDRFDLSMCSSLRHLSVTCSPDVCYISMIPVLPTLISLHVSGCHAACIPRLIKLEKLTLVSSTIADLPPLPSLSHFSIKNCKINQSLLYQVIFRCADWKSSNNVLILELERISFEIPSIQPSPKKSSRPLSLLNLSSSNSIEDSFISFIQGMFDCSNIAHVDFTGLYKITLPTIFSVISCNSLQHLSLSSCFKINDSLFRSLQFPNITYLDISYCSSITDSALSSIAAYAENISTFILAGCFRVTDTGVSSFFHLQRTNSFKLNLLDLSQCTLLSDYCLQSLASKIESSNQINSSHLTIRISGCILITSENQTLKQVTLCKGLALLVEL